MLFINRLSISINLSDQEIVLYIPVSTINFLFINTSRRKVSPTHPPTTSGWDVKNEYYSFLLKIKKSVYKILPSHLPQCNARE
jgi:hypothetical protein